MNDPTKHPNFTDWLLMAAVLLIAVVLMTSCSPRVTEATTTTQHADTTEGFIPVQDTILVHSTDTFRVGINTDSLIQLLNQQGRGPVAGLVAPRPRIIAQHTHNGVTSIMQLVNGRVECEATIDSMQHVLDSVRQQRIHVTTDNLQVKTVYECRSRFHIFLLVFFYAICGLAAGVLVTKFFRPRL
jgi:hypothetical protein